MRTARIVIALGLFIGVGVFGVFMVNELANPPQSVRPANQFGTNDQPLITPQLDGPGSLADLAKPNPQQFIPIIRDNPHPGRITPYRDADTFGQPPYRQPNDDGEVWEFAAYRMTDAKAEQAVAHYADQAKARGLTLLRKGDTGSELPNGVKAIWTDGTDRLEVTAWPQPVQPPVRPMLNWVVKYSYPNPDRND